MSKPNALSRILTAIENGESITLAQYQSWFKHNKTHSDDFYKTALEIAAHIPENTRLQAYIPLLKDSKRLYSVQSKIWKKLTQAIIHLAAAPALSPVKAHQVLEALRTSLPEQYQDVHPDLAAAYNKLADQLSGEEYKDTLVQALTLSPLHAAETTDICEKLHRVTKNADDTSYVERIHYAKAILNYLKKSDTGFYKEVFDHLITQIKKLDIASNRIKHLQKIIHHAPKADIQTIFETLYDEVQNLPDAKERIELLTYIWTGQHDYKINLLDSPCTNLSLSAHSNDIDSDVDAYEALKTIKERHSYIFVKESDENKIAFFNTMVNRLKKMPVDHYTIEEYFNLLIDSPSQDLRKTIVAEIIQLCMNATFRPIESRFHDLTRLNGYNNNSDLYATGLAHLLAESTPVNPALTEEIADYILTDVPDNTHLVINAINALSDLSQRDNITPEQKTALLFKATKASIIHASKSDTTKDALHASRLTHQYIQHVVETSEFPFDQLRDNIGKINHQKFTRYALPAMEELPPQTGTGAYFNKKILRDLSEQYGHTEIQSKIEAGMQAYIESPDTPIEDVIDTQQTTYLTSVDRHSDVAKRAVNIVFNRASQLPKAAQKPVYQWLYQNVDETDHPHIQAASARALFNLLKSEKSITPKDFALRRKLAVFIEKLDSLTLANP